MGFDSITGVAIVFCGAGAGFAGAFMNPFTVQVAQGIAELPLLSQTPFRVVMYVCFVALAILFVMRYAMKVKKNPQLSPMHAFDQTGEDTVDLEELPSFGGKEKAILIVFVLAIILLVFGVIKWGWYMDEIAALFLGMSFIVAVIARMGFNNYANVLGKGMADIASGALVVGFARGIFGCYDRRTDLTYDSSCGCRRAFQAAFHDFRCRHVHLPVSVELHRSIRLRSGCCFHSNHGSAGRFGRCD